jgi:hypothetical protein
VAFIEVDGFLQSDLDAFNRTYGLPQATPEVYMPKGATKKVMPAAEGETEMDLEYAHALAPAARMQVYEVLNTSSFNGYARSLADALNAARAHGATVVSMSLRATDSFFCSQRHAAEQMHSTLENLTKNGISVFAASGDYGASPCQTHALQVGTVYPAADPAVTSVGGTRLSLTGTSSYRGETAWTGSGGGDTSDFARPSWQHGPGSLDGSAAKPPARYTEPIVCQYGPGSPNGPAREVPDVAFDADPNSGVAVLLKGKWEVIGGTSLGAPCWAALWALAGQAHRARTGQALGWANPLLYKLANTAQRTRVFHDVTTGNNGYYDAGPGWDAVTGWGSPNADALVQALSDVAQGTSPTLTSYYFADGDTSGGTHTAIALLNTTETNAAVTLTFLHAEQAERTSSVRVPAHTQLPVDLNELAGSEQHVSTIVTSTTRIAAQCTVSYAGADDAIALPAQAPSTRWYEAEGYAGGSFQTSLVIANPNSSDATADVQFLPFNGRSPTDVQVTVRPRSNLTIDANRYMSKQSFSMIVTSDTGVVIARTMRFGVHHRGATVGHGSALASTSWVFAVGDASASRQTFLTILNPNQSSAATVTATFYNSKGRPVGNRTIVVNPLRRGNIKLNGVVHNGRVAMVVRGSVPVVVERPLYEGAGAANLDQTTAGVVVFGRTGGGRSWLFPGASQGNGNQDTYYFYNLGSRANAISATFYTSTGQMIHQSIVLPPRGTGQLDGAAISGLASSATYGVRFTSTNNQLFVVEQRTQNSGAGQLDGTQGIAE